jgi:hypothetical protein
MSDRAFVATRKGLFTIRRQAGQWRVSAAAFVADNVTLVLPDVRDGSIYAALDHGHFGAKMHRSTDGGETWTEIAAPVYPPAPEGPPEMDTMGRPVPWSLKLVWALEAAGPRVEDGLWCGTIPGGLFRSIDQGASWQLVESLWNHPARKQWFGGGADLPGIHSVCVDPRDSRRLLVAVSCGGVWETRDGGASWSVRCDGMWAAYMPPERRSDPSIQDPHHMVMCRSDPDTLWVQHHNGVFRSTDGAASWREIDKVRPSTFGFAVAVHPDEPGTAWFVPARSDEKRLPVDGKFVVARTRDGGETFDVLTRGLPQEHAYDLVYRHGLDVDESGQRILLGSTTGSLWVSDDQGEHFTAVSHHLPPIYSVRFAA